MPASIRADRTDLADTSATTTRVSTASGETREASASAAEQLRSELDDVTNEMTRTFTTTAEQLLTQIRSFSRTVQASDWDGNAKQAALQGASALETQVQTVLTTAQESVATFRTEMNRDAEALHQSVTNEFGNVLTEFGDRYRGLSTTLQTVDAELGDLDAGFHA